ncbi:unnamed protein product [Peniophora sp. CBMAI 1063]|nr:unnamed protein product [Peniophora sp. CBMAI 1063]
MSAPRRTSATQPLPEPEMSSVSSGITLPRYNVPRPQSPSRPPPAVSSRHVETTGPLSAPPSPHDDEDSPSWTPRYASYGKLSQFVPMTPDPVGSPRPQVTNTDSQSLARMELALGDANSKIDVLRDEVKTLEKDLVGRQDRLEKAEESARVAEEAVREARAERDKLHGRVRELNKQIEQDRRSYKEKEGEVKDLTATLESKEGVLKLAVSERDALRISRTELLAANAHLEPAKREIETLKEDLEQARQDLEKARADAEQALERVRALESACIDAEGDAQPSETMAQEMGIFGTGITDFPGASASWEGHNLQEFDTEDDWNSVPTPSSPLTLEPHSGIREEVDSTVQPVDTQADVAGLQALVKHLEGELDRMTLSSDRHMRLGELHEKISDMRRTMLERARGLLDEFRKIRPPRQQQVDARPDSTQNLESPAIASSESPISTTATERSHNTRGVQTQPDVVMAIGEGGDTVTSGLFMAHTKPVGKVPLGDRDMHGPPSKRHTVAPVNAAKPVRIESIWSSALSGFCWALVALLALILRSQAKNGAYAWAVAVISEEL